jgi:hypothetical protein
MPWPKPRAPPALARSHNAHWLAAPQNKKFFCFFFSKKKAFFFEKKKQKTFISYALTNA